MTQVIAHFAPRGPARVLTRWRLQAQASAATENAAAQSKSPNMLSPTGTGGLPITN